MPKYTNRFNEPSYWEHEILGPDGKKLGKVRIKPSSIAWMPAYGREFFSVSLDTFVAWIKNPDSGSSKTKS